MSATATVQHRHNLGSINAVFATITLDSSYPTGGEDITALGASFGFSEIVEVVVVDAEGYDVSYVPASGKLIVRYSDDNDTSDGPSIEVPDTTNLATVDVRVILFGV